jgi:hypothetical protein
MIVTALTETCDYNKQPPASCKRARLEEKIYFCDAKKTELDFSTSKCRIRRRRPFQFEKGIHH